MEGRYPNGTPFGLKGLFEQASGTDAPPPHGLSWGNADTRQLATWVRMNPTWVGNLRIRPASTQSTMHGGGKAYVIERLEGTQPDGTQMAPPDLNGAVLVRDGVEAGDAAQAMPVPANREVALSRLEHELNLARTRLSQDSSALISPSGLPAA